MLIENLVMAKTRVSKAKNRRARQSQRPAVRRDEESVVPGKKPEKVQALDVIAEMPADMFPRKAKDSTPDRRKGLEGFVFS